jgi:hypothetical protein
MKLTPEEEDLISRKICYFDKTEWRLRLYHGPRITKAIRDRFQELEELAVQTLMAEFHADEERVRRELVYRLGPPEPICGGKITQEMVDDMIQARDFGGMSQKKIAAAYGVSEWTVHKRLKDVGATRTNAPGAGRPKRGGSV